MIGGSLKRTRELAFELQNSRVYEESSSGTLLFESLS